MSSSPVDSDYLTSLSMLHPTLAVDNVDVVTVIVQVTHRKEWRLNWDNVDLCVSSHPADVQLVLSLSMFGSDGATVVAT